MLVDSVANAVLDLILGTTGVLPSTVYIGLLLAAPNPDGTGVVEVAGSGYARVAVPNNGTWWPNASGREKTHANDIIWGAASGGPWGTITHVGFFDAASGGNLRAAGALDTPREVLDTDVFRFLAGSSPLKLTL